MNNLNKRNKAETRFKLYGISAVIIAITFLFVLLFNIFSSGASAFKASYIGVKIEIPSAMNIDEINSRKEFKRQVLKMFPEG
jgi:phosphate transport system permease protein